MFFLILAMLVATVLGVAVVGVVAVPARLEGRDVLTAKGEEVVESVRDRAATLGRRAAGPL
jgi:hypothetical protein